MNRLPTATVQRLSRPLNSITAAFLSSSAPILSSTHTAPDQPKPLRRNGGRKKRGRSLRIFKRPIVTPEEYNPPTPPRSPLLDTEIFLPYSETHKKTAPTAGNKLSPREWALRLNPYAQILASPVRIDVDYHRRLPSSLLIRMVRKRHPETGQVWLLPTKLDINEPRSNTSSSYTLGTISGIRAYTPNVGRGSRVWAKLLPDGERHGQNTVWRPDMPDFVLMKMRRRVVEECSRAKLSTDVDRVVGGPEAWMLAGETMCVVDFRASPEVDASDYEDDDTMKNMTSAGWRHREPPPPMDRMGVLAVVGGRRVPVHRMREMLGEEYTEMLRAKWRVETNREVMALMMTQRTLEAQVWLMRLRYYLEFYYQPVNSGRKFY